MPGIMTSCVKSPRYPFFLACAALVVLWSSGVEATFTNVALKKPSKQVDDLHDRAQSHLANDGDLSPSFNAGKCTHTRVTSKTWWLVDLIHTYDVYTVRILNRDRDSARLSNFYVYVSADNPLPISDSTISGQLCLFHEGMLPNNGIQELRCVQPTRGRYVYVWKPLDNGVLTICEFEVLVDLKSRQMGCSVETGTKVALTPGYYEDMKQPSFQNCLLICASAPERDATHLQINWHSGRCECIQVSFLLTFDDVEYKIAEGYDMCALKETNSGN